MTIDHTDLLRGLSRVERDQVPYAASRALNDVAAGAVKELPTHMERVFDNPTRFTKSAFRIERATKSKLEAKVLPKTRQGGRHFLFVQEEGGRRPETGIEGLIKSNTAFDGVVHSVTPGDDAKLNAHGNLRPSEVQRLLSGLGAQRDAAQNTTEASRSRARSRETYFIPKGGGLTPAVFARKYTPADRERGRKAKDVRRLVLKLHQTVPHYDRRFEYQDYVADFMADQFPDAFRDWLAKAVASGK